MIGLNTSSNDTVTRIKIFIVLYGDDLCFFGNNASPPVTLYLRKTLDSL